VSPRVSREKRGFNCMPNAMPNRMPNGMGRTHSQMLDFARAECHMGARSPTSSEFVGQKKRDPSPAIKWRAGAVRGTLRGPRDRDPETSPGHH
jgi:hypothetical protein